MPAPRHRPLEPFGVRVDAAGTPLADLPVDPLRDLVREHHLLLLRGFEPFATAADLTAYCRRWGAVSLWPFGAVLELVEHENPGDHIFDHSHVPLHWDGMYRPQVPEFQVFQCVSAPADDQGGRTTFAHTAAAYRAADERTRALWGGVTGTYRRAMEFYDSEAVSPLVTAHPTRGFPVLRYAEPAADDADFVNHPDMSFTGLPDGDTEAFHAGVRAALHDPAHHHAHAWRAGDVVVADNYTLLHGRESFTSRAPRHLRRVHVLGDPPLDNPALTRGGTP